MSSIDNIEERMLNKGEYNGELLKKMINNNEMLSKVKILPMILNFLLPKELELCNLNNNTNN
jgi:hypothetical protein